jgi:hypothetical protein
VSVLYVLLAFSTLMQGPEAVLGPFQFPAAILESPHFGDFFHWVFVHMATIGILIGLLGRLVREPRDQRVVALVLVALELHYTYLDWRTSTLGSGLYPGPRSLVPFSIDVLVTLGFAWFAFRPTAPSRLTVGA